jgi:hypothetical protein
MSNDVAMICTVAIPISAIVCVVNFRILLKANPANRSNSVAFGFAAAIGLVCSIPFYGTEQKWIAYLVPIYFLGIVFSMIGYILHTVIQNNSNSKDVDDKEHEDSNRPRGTLVD